LLGCADWEVKGVDGWWVKGDHGLTPLRVGEVFGRAVLVGKAFGENIMGRRAVVFIVVRCESSGEQSSETSRIWAIVEGVCFSLGDAGPFHERIVVTVPNGS